MPVTWVSKKSSKSSINTLQMLFGYIRPQIFVRKEKKSHCRRLLKCKFSLHHHCTELFRHLRIGVVENSFQNSLMRSSNLTISWMTTENRVLDEITEVRQTLLTWAKISVGTQEKCWRHCEPRQEQKHKANSSNNWYKREKNSEISTMKTVLKIPLVRRI